MSKQITFDKVHTKEKQKLLKIKMNEVAELIHKRFSLKDKINVCPVCASKMINFHVNKYGFNMDKCDECEHIFTNPFPSEEALNFYYNSELKQFENKFFEDSFEDRVPIFTKRIEIINKLGLHARSSSKLVELANKFICQITIEKNQKIANAKSIMAVMMLSANRGSIITIKADGIDEKEATQAISDLINNKFNELDS